MSTLRISLLGEIRVDHEDASSEIQLTPLLQLLLAYLVLQRQTCHPRLFLMELFWSGYSEKHAQRCLRTALWRLRQALEPTDQLAGRYLISTATNGIRFNRDSDYWLDVEAFEQGLRKWRSGELTETAVIHFQAALDLYNGDFLNGHYDDWVIVERERLQNLYINGLTQMMHYFIAQKVYEKGLDCGQKILRVDQLREEIHREMMRIYAATGQRSLAIRQYNHCTAILNQELNVDPMPETRQLYFQILASNSESQELSDSVAVVSSSLGENSQKEAYQYLKQTMVQFEKAYQSLQQATAIFYSVNK